MNSSSCTIDSILRVRIIMGIIIVSRDTDHFVVDSRVLEYYLSSHIIAYR